MEPTKLSRPLSHTDTVLEALAKSNNYIEVNVIASAAKLKMDAMILERAVASLLGRVFEDINVLLQANTRDLTDQPMHNINYNIKEMALSLRRVRENANIFQRWRFPTK